MIIALGRAEVVGLGLEVAGRIWALDLQEEEVVVAVSMVAGILADMFVPSPNKNPDIWDFGF